MGRAGRLRATAAAVVVLLRLAVAAVPAAASDNDVPGSRAALITRGISVQDLAPAACADMGLTDLVTAANLQGGQIRGGNGRDLILGTAGPDRLRGMNGDDCLVGGAGADDLDGGNGRDVCVAGGDPGDATSRCEA